MTLTALQTLLKEARLARNTNAVNALGAAISDIQCAQGRTGDTFDENQILNSIRKSRDVLQEEWTQMANMTLITPAQFQRLEDLSTRRDILTELLPKVIDESNYQDIAALYIIQHDATTMKDMGKVLNAIKSHYGLRIDPAKMSGVVKGLLQPK